MTTWFFMILGSCLISQGFTIPERETDSLKAALYDGQKDTATVNTLYRLFWAYRRSSLDSAFKYASHGLSLSRDIRYREGTANHLYALGIVHKARGDFDEAVDLFSKATIAYDEAEKPSGLISCITELAAIGIKQGHYEKSLEYLHQALSKYGDTIPNERLSRIYSMIGGVYSALEQNDKALEYHHKSLEINKKENIEIGISVNYNNIGNVYRNIGMYDKAIDNFLESKVIKEKLGDIYGLATVYNNLGTCYLAMGKYGEAIVHHQNALKLFSEMGDKHGIALGQVNLGVDYLEAGELSRSVEYAQNAIETAREQNILEILAEATLTLADAYSRMGMYRRALTYQKQHEAYSDSLMNREVMETISDLENRLELENKEKEIALLNAEREKQELKLQKRTLLRNLMGVTFFLSLIVLILLYNSFRSKQKINRKLKEINRTKSRFFANISHEFRTPLTLLIGPLEELLRKAKDKDKPLLRMMHRNAGRLLLLNNQFMDLSRLESGTFTVKLKRGNITEAMKGMVVSFESLARQKNIRFACVFPEEPVVIYFDLDILEKIIYNLLSNAFRFTPENGKVSFFARTAGTPKKSAPPSREEISGHQQLELTVEDTGKGIPKEHIDKIFDRFFQSDSGFQNERGGVGIGLSITKEMAEIHHGTIRVDSTAGSGTRFTVAIPLNEEIWPADMRIAAEEYSEEPTGSSTENTLPETISPSRQNATTIRSDEGKPLLLLVEDNSEMRTYIRNMLLNDFVVEEAVDGSDGLRKATDIIPDLTITDLMMPGIDGVDLCRILKTDERTGHIPVIMLTALATVEHRIAGLETGADDYITKPFNRKELKVRCFNLIEQRKKLREKFRKEMLEGSVSSRPVSMDERFMAKVTDTLEKHIADPELGVEMLMKEVGMSRSQLHRKLKALTDQSSTEFIRNFRLKRASLLLKSGFGSVAEVCYAVGFNSLSYFTRSFHELFGMAPSGYRETES